VAQALSPANYISSQLLTVAAPIGALRHPYQTRQALAFAIG
jgi:hypothetical protein